MAFGGHKEAAGFTIKKENFKNFKKALTAYAEKNLKNPYKPFKNFINFSCELRLVCFNHPPYLKQVYWNVHKIVDT